MYSWQAWKEIPGWAMGLGVPNNIYNDYGTTVGMLFFIDKLIKELSQ